MFDQFLGVSQSAMMTAGVILIPVLLSSLLVGLIVGIFQATTQIQEMTLSFLPKLVVIGGILLLAGPWFLRVLTHFAQTDFTGLWKISMLH